VIRDAQGHELTDAIADAAQSVDAGARAYSLAYGDPMAHFDAARAAAPRCAMAELGKAWLLAMSNDPTGVMTARTAVERIRVLPMNERERAHLAALEHAAAGRWASAATVLDRHLMRYPFDLMAHQTVMRLEGYLGRFHLTAGRAARVLPLWSEDRPGYGILYSFYGFGLEELGQYAKAEEISRQAAGLEPHGYWPHHTVSHVLEMTGRPAEGLKWMAEREPLWSAKDNTNRVHIHWHKALFHVELGDHDAALALLDGPIRATLRPIGNSLCNATALLWRLEMLGLEAGERWQDYAELWRGRANGATSVFNDIHAAVTLLRAGDDDGFARLRASMLETASAGTEQSPTWREVGLPVVDGLREFTRGAYAHVVEHLLPARFGLSRMGGSHAQRDIIDWTLTEAALRAGMRDVAVALANERLALRPESAPNRRFLAAAEQLAA
jgi:tetratricopeptide (TPR) repeat protein